MSACGCLCHFGQGEFCACSPDECAPVAPAKQPCPHCVHPTADGKPMHCLICAPDRCEEGYCDIPEHWDDDVHVGPMPDGAKPDGEAEWKGWTSHEHKPTYTVVSDLKEQESGHRCTFGCDSPHAVNCNCQGRCDFHEKSDDR